MVERDFLPHIFAEAGNQFIGRVEIDLAPYRGDFSPCAADVMPEVLEMDIIGAYFFVVYVLRNR
jgi:hypothetical protein